MAIEKINKYLPDQDLANLAENVDDNRLGLDLSEIEVSFATSPATVTIKLGSIIEVNGNWYKITSADYVFQMANATHNYITLTDNPAVAFSSAAAKGTFTAAKQGYYQTGNLIRTCKWFIDQTNEVYAIDQDNETGHGQNQTQINSFAYTLTNAVSVATFQQVGSTGGTGTYNYDTNRILIKKPVSLLIQNVSSATNGFAVVSLEYNSAYYISIGLARVPKNLTQHISLNPGVYAVGVASDGGTTTVDLFLIGVYGNAELDTSDVFEIL